MNKVIKPQTTNQYNNSNKQLLRTWKRDQRLWTEIATKAKEERQNNASSKVNLNHYKVQKKSKNRSRVEKINSGRIFTMR